MPPNLTASCLLNKAIDCQERTMYDNNMPLEAPDFSIYQDYTINYSVLLDTQEWTLPLENQIIEKTEAFLIDLRDNPDLIEAEDMSHFSHIAAEFAYENYTHQSADYYEWDSGIPEPCFLSAISSEKADDRFDFYF